MNPTSEQIIDPQQDPKDATWHPTHVHYFAPIEWELDREDTKEFKEVMMDLMNIYKSWPPNNVVRVVRLRCMVGDCEEVREVK